jgi:hypothetical protein
MFKCNFCNIEIKVLDCTLCFLCNYLISVNMCMSCMQKIAIELGHPICSVCLIGEDRESINFKIEEAILVAI